MTFHEWTIFLCGVGAGELLGLATITILIWASAARERG